MNYEEYKRRTSLIKLKVKAKSLAAEAKIIKKEELKLLKVPAGSKYAISEAFLTDHRKWDVRNEARSTHLTIAYLKGKKYKQVELSCKEIEKRDLYIVKRILAMVQKYGDKKTTRDQILNWIYE